MMNLYKDIEGQFFEYTDNQVKLGLAQGLYEATESEMELLTTPAPKPDPVSATQRKIVEVLKQMGKWSEYRAYIHADPDRYDAFYLSQEIRIDDPFIQDAIDDPGFDLTQEQAQQIINAANGFS